MTSLTGGGVTVRAEDVFLTIGGGYSPSGNQASLEKNVLYFQRVLKRENLDRSKHVVYFSDGSDRVRDLQVIDRESVPKANRLMAEFFGDTDDLGLSYRNHQINNVRGSTRPENIRQWFDVEGKQLKSGDRLVVYVTTHGNRSGERGDPYNTTIATWNNSSIKMKEFVRLLDGLDPGVEVIAVMVQCHAGGFARFIFNDGDPDQGLSRQRRIGFFATVHDRAAAGCTPEVDEANYVEYSTYFWAALSGLDRLGEKIEKPDYDGDGKISFEEAHAYVILTADTIDLPVKSSGEYLTQFSKFDSERPELLTNEEPYDTVLLHASPTQRAILEGLSEQLGLEGMTGWSTRGKRPSRTGTPPRAVARSTNDLATGTAQESIRNDLRRKWPALANVLNPVSIELVTSRSQEFIGAVEGHPEYERYQQLKAEAASSEDDKKLQVKYDRFLRAADNVLLAENLRRLGDASKVAEYDAIVLAENQGLSKAGSESQPASR